MRIAANDRDMLGFFGCAYNGIRRPLSWDTEPHVPPRNHRLALFPIGQYLERYGAYGRAVAGGGDALNGRVSGISK